MCYTDGSLHGNKSNECKISMSFDGVQSWVEAIKNIRQLVEIIKGYNGLKKHLHTMGIVNNPICERAI